MSFKKVVLFMYRLSNPPFFLLDHFPESKEQTLAIFDAKSLDDTIPEGFNAVVITLDGRTISDLDWKKERLATLRYIEQGLRIFWTIDLGLFSKLSLPLTDQTQYLALGLSLRHFRDSLWKEFQKQTIGLCFYRGNSDFSDSFPWDEEQNLNFKGWLQDRFQTISCLTSEVGLGLSNFDQVNYSVFKKSVAGSRLLRLFCCDVAAEYLNLLAQTLPDLLTLFLLLETESLKDPLLLAHLLSKEHFVRMLRMTSQGILPLSSLMGTQASSGYLASTRHFQTIPKAIKVGAVFPVFSYSSPLNEALNKLIQHQISFRMIPENLLMMEWDGLDFLVVPLAALSPQGIRQLRGFCAAGGVIVSCDSLEKREERFHVIPFSKWIELEVH